MAPSSFCVSAPGRGQPTADPGGGGTDGTGGGEQSRRHRPMVQSSRGWDEAPRSGWGVKPSAPSTRKGARPLREAVWAPRRARASGPPASSPRLAACPAPPERLACPAGRALLSSPPALVGPGRRLGCLRAGRRLGGRVFAGRDPCGGWRRAWPWVLVLVSRPGFPSRPARPCGSVCNRGGGLGRTEAEDLQSWRVQSFGSRAPLELMLKQKSVARLLKY